MKKTGGAKKRTYKKKTYKKVTTKKAQVALIKSVIAKQEETKFRSELIEDRVGHNSQITTGDFIRALPKLVQEQGDGVIFERLGRKITVRKAYLDLDISLQTGTSLAPVNRSMALVVHVWVLTMKSVKDLNLLSTVINPYAGRLLITGDTAQYQQFNGYAQDAQLPINTNQFTVLKKVTFLLGKNTGIIQDSSTASNQPLGGQAVRKQLRIQLKGPKEYLYEQDDNSPRVEYYPKNFAPFYAVSYHHQDLSAPDVLNLDVNVTSRASIWYDDA